MGRKGRVRKAKMIQYTGNRSDEGFFSPQNRKHQNAIPLEEHKVANYVKSPWTHSERGFSLPTKSGSRHLKSGQSMGFLLSA